MNSALDALQNNQAGYVYGSSQLSHLSNHPLALAYVSLIVVEKGQIRLNIQFQDYLLKAGDVLILAEDSLAIVKNQSDDFSCQYYLLNRDFAAEVAYVLPHSLFAYLSKTPVFSPILEHAILLQAWQTQSQFILNKTTQYQRILWRQHLQNFFLILADIIGDQRPLNQNEHSRKEKLCWQFWAMVAQHSQQEREVAFYARTLHITPYYLSQLCQHYLNDNPKTLIDRQVILKLKQLLKTNGLSIQSIADKMHFNDPSYMNRYFKKHTGLTLRQYRKGH